MINKLLFKLIIGDHMKKIIGRNISILYRNENQFLDQKLKPYNLNKVQAEIILYLYNNDGINQKTLNNFFMFNKATITKITTHLENHNYLMKVISKNDQRERNLFLTKKGNNIFPIIINTLKQREDILLKGINNKELEILKRLLSQMVDNITQLKEVENEQV
jgi:DNA-binding MarR family transcriptional regulator